MAAGNAHGSWNSPSVAEDFNHAHIAVQAKRLGGRVLDFGCGRANVVRLLRADGVEAFGADVFFGGMDWNNGGPDDLIAAGVVRLIVDGVLPFEDQAFDTIVSDQVIEHVEDIGAAVGQMARVLKPGGRMYHQYPTLNVIREAHTSVPWAHRLPPRLRVPYLAIAHRARIARRDVDASASGLYAQHMSEWIDEYCRYRSRSEIEAAFERHGFAVRHCEAEYCRSRAAGRRLLGMIERVPPVAARAFRLVGFDCIETA
jgi:SAM-dependent methyltransferase